MASAAAKVVLVTGANSGIGYEAVKALLESERHYHVLLGSRSTANGQSAVASLREACPDSGSSVEALELDLTSDSSIENAYETVKRSPGRLDVLISNAGATFDLEFLAGKTSLRECFNRAYDVNVAGTHVLTATFMPLLLQSSDPRLLFTAGLANQTLASQKYFPTPPLPAGWPKRLDFETIGYRCSKTALNMLMLDWNHKLQQDGVKVWAVAPGMLATNLGRMPELAQKMGAKHPSLGGQILRSVVEGQRDADVGKIVNRDGISSF